MKTSMRIAAVTDDGVTISPHFGRARYFEVLTIENGAISKRERREKAGHHTFEKLAEHRHYHGDGPEQDQEGHDRKHAQMAATINDCDVVLARGMGYGAYEGMAQHNIKPILTDIGSIDEAVRAVVEGTIVDHSERLH
jgi:predicted Fe-Mo cluster-binding NifX family protein